jgi:HlyD family secretion protein
MRRIVLILLSPILLLTGCGEEEKAPAGSGMIEATEIVVSSEATGRVMKLYFDEGTELSQGDTLAVLDDSKLKLQLESARANREVAEAKLSAARLEARNAQSTEEYTAKELARVRKLVASNTATQRQLDEVEHRHTSAQIAVEAARASIKTIQAEITRTDAEIALIRDRIDDAHPTAPASGTVTEKYTDQGELLAPGAPIARVSQLDSVWVKIYLPMKDFARVKIGDSATVDTETGTKYAGTVTWTADDAEFTPKNVQTKKSRADLVYAIKVWMANPDHALKVGQPVYVTVSE